LALEFDEFDRARAKILQAIALSEEYRSALITNAVTGKIDVRGLANKELAA
jgi:type I restriction enzyme S subunit